MALPDLFGGSYAHTCACPAHRGVGISSRHGFHQPFQILLPVGIGAHRCGASATRSNRGVICVSLSFIPPVSHISPHVVTVLS